MQNLPAPAAQRVVFLLLLSACKRLQAHLSRALPHTGSTVQSPELVCHVFFSGGVLCSGDPSLHTACVHLATRCSHCGRCWKIPVTHLLDACPLRRIPHGNRTLSNAGNQSLVLNLRETSKGTMSRDSFCLVARSKSNTQQALKSRWDKCWQWSGLSSPLTHLHAPSLAPACPHPPT